MVQGGPQIEVEVVPDGEESSISDVVQAPVGFSANLAEHLSEHDLNAVGQELVQDFDTDKNSRQEWEKTLADGLELLGLTMEKRSIPWQGACGVFHPLLAETLVRFQAQAIMEIFPAAGPARTQIIGKSTKEKQDLADRKEDEMNYILTEVMPDYRAETEQLLIRLGLAGTGFRKIYYDPALKRPMALYVSAEDFVVAFGTTDLRTCPRATHIMRRTENEVRKMQVSGFYRDVDLPEPSPDTSKLDEVYNKLNGMTATIEADSRYRLLEMCVDLDLPGFEDPTGIELPYIVTVEQQSKKVLSIYRNWEEHDQTKTRRQYYVKWMYLPGLGFYGIGLIHLIGGMARSATSILRQLIDAGTLSNLPGGLKTRGLRIKGDSAPIMPGEWRDVDVSTGVLKDSIMPLPYKEPSQVLAALLGTLVQEAKSMGAVADMTVAENNPTAPVGTTLALLEREMKVMSAVQARLHGAVKEELKLISNIIANDMPDQYLTHPEDGASRRKDFSSKIVAVIPVSDPNATTAGQRILQYQAAMEMAQKAPTLFDLPILARQTLNAYGVRGSGDIVKSPDDIQPTDPVAENMAILNGKPVKAFEWQDHDAHIAVHMAAVQDPKIAQMVGQSPTASAVGAAAAAHVVEHLAFKYRNDIQKQLGTQLPPLGQPLPPQVEVQFSSLVAAAAGKLLQKDQAEAAQQQAAQQAQDPVLQQQQGELEVKKAQVVANMLRDKAQMDRRSQSEKDRIAIDQQRIASAERIAKAQIMAKLAETVGNMDLDSQQLESDDQAARAQIAQALSQQIQDQHNATMDRGVDLMKHTTQLAHDHQQNELDRKAQADAAAKAAQAKPASPAE